MGNHWEIKLIQLVYLHNPIENDITLVKALTSGRIFSNIEIKT